MIKISSKFNTGISFKSQNTNASSQVPQTFKMFDKAPTAPDLASSNSVVTSDTLLSQLPNVSLPRGGRNHCVFDENKVNSYVKRREQAIPELKKILQTSKDEKQIVEALYILDKMVDSGVKGIDKLYPVLSNFNDTDSPNIQVFLVGIYRKTQVPDAFGPLVKMLIKDSSLSVEEKTNNKAKSAENCPNCKSFDPTEEIGGAILEYIRNYSNIPQKTAQK